MMQPRVSRHEGLTVIFKSQFSFNLIAVGIGCFVALAPSFGVRPAHATELTVVRQTPQEFSCMFDSACSSQPPGNGGGIYPPEPSSDRRLSASTFPARPGSPADGNTIYVYRIDLTNPADKDAECVAAVTLNFGPIAQIPPITATSHVYILDGADPNATMHVKSAEQDGDTVQLNFEGDFCSGKSSFMFLLPSKYAREYGRGAILTYGYPPITPVKILAPNYPLKEISNFGTPE